jgi:NADP-dependent 3-hydroxy acid dehydrogenase YdfG
MQLPDSRVLVTGASTGIGRVTALRLAAKGARVWVAARDEQRLKSLASEHPSIVPVAADVTIETDRAALVEACEPVDVLVNNAGLGWKGLVEDMEPAQVRELFEINVLALIDLTQRVLPGMLEVAAATSSTSVPSRATWLRPGKPSTARPSSPSKGSPTVSVVSSPGAAST